MPTEEDAISIKKSALKFGKYILTLKENERFQRLSEHSDLPEEIKELNPLRVYVDELGICVVFETDFVEGYGYFYRFENVKEKNYFARNEIAKDIFYYYNPG